jgi:hypothetical protein
MDEDNRIGVKFRRGDFFGVAGKATLPTDSWTAAAALYDESRKAYIAGGGGISVAMAALNVNALDSTKTDYALTFTATATATGLWPAKHPLDPIWLLCQVRFTGSNGQPKSAKNPFYIGVTT